MNFSEQRSIAVGAAVFAVLVVGAALFSTTGGPDATAGYYRVEATFNRIDGLSSGDEIRLGGVRVGTVGEQSLDENYLARVDLMIDDGVVLPTDTSAAIHTDGLFGSKYVVLEPGGEEINLKDGDAIYFTQDSLIVSELLELIIAQGKQQAKEAAAARAQIKRAKKILDGNDGQKGAD